MGKLIVIEGVDSSGKQTQTDLLYEYLKTIKNDVMKLTFPDYESDSSALVKMYLNGDFGENASDVSPYIASTFYAADRFASYKTKWEKYYLGNGVIVADRYTTSNMVHQASKFDDEDEKDKFLKWLYDFEYNLYKIPQPDLTIFLDMPPYYARVLMEKRLNKITGLEAKDIHEKDQNHLEHAYNNACSVAEKFGWVRIECVKDGNIRTIEDIQQQIRSEVIKVL